MGELSDGWGNVKKKIWGGTKPKAKKDIDAKLKKVSRSGLTRRKCRRKTERFAKRLHPAKGNETRTPHDASWENLNNLRHRDRLHARLKRNVRVRTPAFYEVFRKVQRSASRTKGSNGEQNSKIK